MEKPWRRHSRQAVWLKRANHFAMWLVLIPTFFHIKLGISEWLCVGCSIASIALAVVVFVRYRCLPAGAKVDFNRLGRTDDWESGRPGMWQFVGLLLLNAFVLVGVCLPAII